MRSTASASRCSALPKANAALAFKYFKEFADRSTYQGYSLQVVGVDQLLDQLGTCEDEGMAESMLELDDIQSGVLRPRPTPYAAAYVLFRIDERKAGRELMRRIRPVVASAAHPASPAGDTWVSVALSFQGLKALGVPQASLDSFPPEFQQGMAARAKVLGDTGESSPEHWEKPLGSADVHVVVTALPQIRSGLKPRSNGPASSIEKICRASPRSGSQNCHVLAE